MQLVAVLYPKVTVTVVPVAGVMLEPLTVIVVPGGPDVGVLVIEGGDAVTVKVLLLVSTGVLLLLPIMRQTLYVPTADPAPVVGQVNVALVNPPEVIVTVEPVRVELLPQLVVSYPTLAVPLNSVALQVLSCMPEAFRVIVAPTAPVRGELVNVGDVHVDGSACAGDAVPQRRAISASNSIAEHSTKAMLVETIFDRFPFVFILALPSRIELV